MTTVAVEIRMPAPVNRPSTMVASSTSTVSTPTAGTPNRCPNRRLASITHGSAHTPMTANGMKAATDYLRADTSGAGGVMVSA